MAPTIETEVVELGDVLPDSPPNNVADMTLMNAIDFMQPIHTFSGGIACPDVSHILGGQDRHNGRFSSRHATITDRVIHIVLGRADMQMHRVTTRPSMAPMAHPQACVDRLCIPEFPRNPVAQIDDFFSDDTAIAREQEAPGPLPTAIGAITAVITDRHFAPKTLIHASRGILARLRTIPPHAIDGFLWRHVKGFAAHITPRIRLFTHRISVACHGAIFAFAFGIMGRPDTKAGMAEKADTLDTVVLRPWAAL